ncbi:MAG: folylpolyglutamate synthase/dihydrofolate synthase family protein [Sphaerochaetaceae bacterium]|nr:folylpolyglutamate synthase/dihydrofolate synthase family protein [Sphaerochaetaceae bacterium]
MQFNTFADVVAFMESFNNLEKKGTDHYTTRTYRLDRMFKLLGHLGNPERDFKTIHVAGSKGKGSTASFLAAGLQALGYKTGLYLSPHLVDYRERFTLCGTFFDDDTLVSAGCELAQRLSDFRFSDQWGEIAPTTFELYTCYAFLLFSRTGCQWAVIETGLGGRLDATNTILPVASVLCPIELEHTAILGDTIAKIALEKAKIIKPGVPCFIAKQNPDAREVFLQEAVSQHSKAYFLDEETTDINGMTTALGQRVDIRWADGTDTALTLDMLGEVQADNCALALLTLQKLGLYRHCVTEPAMERNWLPGRMQRLDASRPLYLDGAHTVQSLRHLFRSFGELYGREGNTVIYGALHDKDHLHMVQEVLCQFDNIIISTPGTYKASDIGKLYELFQEQARLLNRRKDIRLIPSANDALRQALDRTPQGKAVLACGSFYLAGEIKKAYDGLQEDHAGTGA